MRAFLDIETGGFSTTKNGICEIALTVVDDDLTPIETFHALIKPYTRADDTDELVSYKDDAMAINGLTVEKLIEEGQPVECVMFGIIDLIKKHGVTTLVGHNSNAFDIPRVQYLVDRFCKEYTPIEYVSHDTMLIAKQKLNLPSYSLPNLCTHFGIVNENSHSAKGDVLATIQLYKILTSL